MRITCDVCLKLKLDLTLSLRLPSSGNEEHCICDAQVVERMRRRRRNATAPPGWWVLAKKRRVGIKTQHVTDKYYIEPGTNKIFRSSKEAWARYVRLGGEPRQD